MSSETILIFGNEKNPLKLLNHLLIAAFGAGFISLSLFSRYLSWDEHKI